MFVVRSGSNSNTFYLCRVMNVGLGYTPSAGACAAAVGWA